MIAPVRNDLIQITEVKATGKLPELMKTADGRDVRTPEEWEARREELLTGAVAYQFGERLDDPDKITVEALRYDRKTAPGSYRVTLIKNGYSLQFVMRVFIP